MARGHQQKRFDARLAIKLPAELRAELDGAAKQGSELVSDVVRRVLVEWAAARVTARCRSATEQSGAARQ